MKVISYLEGSVFVAASWDEIRPIAGAPHVAVLEFLRSKYSFQSVGNSVPSQQAGLMTPHLQTGQFGKESISQIEFLPNAVTITCSTTSTSVALFADLMGALRDAFGFRDVPSDRQSVFRSTIVSDLGFNIGHALHGWKKISEYMDKLRGIEGSTVEPVGFRFFERRGETFDANIQFAIERRFIAPSGAEWAYSQAPLSTEDHEKLLTMISETFR